MGLYQYVKSGLVSLDHGFRRSPQWAFFQLDRQIKNDLYFRERERKRRAEQSRQVAESAARTVLDTATAAGAGAAVPDQSLAGAPPQPAASGTPATASRKRTAEEAGLPPGPPPPEQDKYELLFGRVEPRHIPESGSWWKGQQTELMAISADHELGLPTGMVTMTQNDSSPELLAHARRGPCAAPTEAEKFEYLLTRRAPGSRRPNIQQDATAATLSF